MRPTIAEVYKIRDEKGATTVHIETMADGEHVKHAEMYNDEGELVYIYPDGSRRRIKNPTWRAFGTQWKDFNMSREDGPMMSMARKLVV